MLLVTDDSLYAMLLSVGKVIKYGKLPGRRVSLFEGNYGIHVWVLV